MRVTMSPIEMTERMKDGLRKKLLLLDNLLPFRDDDIDTIILI